MIYLITLLYENKISYIIKNDNNEIYDDIPLNKQSNDRTCKKDPVKIWLASKICASESVQCSSK